MRCVSPLLLVLLTVPLSAQATEDERQLPVNLRADRIDINQKTGISLYRGHVVFSQGSLRLSAAQAEVRSRASTIETVTAEGKPVHIRHLPEGTTEFIEGQASRAIYNVPEQRADLYGDVFIQRGRDQFRGAVLHYDISSRNVLIESSEGRRVYVALEPGGGATPLPEDKP